MQNQRPRSFDLKSQTQRVSRNNFSKSDFQSSAQKDYHQVPSQNQNLKSQKVFQRNNVSYQKQFQNRYTP